MKHRVFYSWQSDLDPSITRNFIEEALKKAAKRSTRDDSILIEPVVDRDTVGAVGALGIADTIFQKIDVSDVFVCDVSIVNGLETSQNIGMAEEILRSAAQVILRRTSASKRETRLMPNPNVLVELGYAAARLGWERIILVQNTAFGRAEDLPFDLRGRRLVTFHVSTKDERADHRTQLNDHVEAALADAFGEMLKPNSWAGVTVPRWFGYWKTPDRPARGNSLLIREESTKGFFFEIWLHDGARTGNVHGRANIIGPDLAYACISGSRDEEPCELKFRRSYEDGRRITIEESDGCRRFCGMGASFRGIYHEIHNYVFDYGFFDEMDLQRLYLITGQYFKRLIELFGGVSEVEILDSINGKALSGGYKGFYTIYEAIVMKSERGAIWAAYLDVDDIKYFTTQHEYKATLPNTFEKWRERFPDKPVIFVDDVQPIDDRF